MKENFENTLKKLENNSNDLDLLNKVAIGYLENPEINLNHEDYEFFKKAYELKKTIKSTHNFAWFLYFEWSELEWQFDSNDAVERAVRIQKECIELKPQSYLPYYLYGYMWLELGMYAEAIKYFEIANNLNSLASIKNNLGIAYFKIGNYLKAKQYFEKALKENELTQKNLYNLAIIEYQLDNHKKVEEIAINILQTIEKQKYYEINAYEIGILYFLIEEYNKATECVIKEGLENIDFLEWKELAYSLFKTDEQLFYNQILKRIKPPTNETDITNSFKINKMDKPNTDTSKYLLLEYCGCLLFDCNRHKNPKDDNKVS